MTQKYAKIINETTKQCEVGIGTNEDFYQSIGMTLQDVEQVYDGSWYIVGNKPIELIKEEKLQELLIKKLENINNPITYNFNEINYEFGITDNDRDNLLSILISCDYTNLFYFDDIQKNSIDFLNKLNLQNLYNAIFLKRTLIRNRNKELENLINNCNNILQLTNPEEEGYIEINFNNI